MIGEKEQRSLIISAAQSLFSRFGLEKTTMEDIAKAAKKGKSSLYYYFKSKEEVFAEVIGKEINGLKSIITDAVKKEDNPRNKLLAFVETRLDYLSKKADQYTTIKDEFLKHYEFIESLTMEYSNWEKYEIRDIIEYGRKKGSFKINDSDNVLNAVYFAFKGMEYPWLIKMSRKELKSVVNELVDILVKGMS
ncbi:MAG: TetR/AcrR family transcriptional regulator [Candidatus Theseobacter exili]|nr:TetR/AcrR family transcriptional regulator [Candidatus Theseobacter exili]